jgi:hypothetical protein
LQDTTIGRLADELLGEWTAKNLVRAIRVGSDAGEASQDWETTSI